ncbi:MAG: IS4 family transposase, partial [Planctomycetota bacterium]
SVHTGGYCQARNRLKETALRNLGAGLGKELVRSEKPDERWRGRRVIIPDGSSVSLPDTLSNQKVYPQPNTQSAGCGFPVMYLSALMSLTSGALLDFETGSGNGNELTLWRKMWHLLQSGDVILGDGKYSSYADIALLRGRGIDVVARFGKRKADFRKGQIIALEDHLVEWERPNQLPDWLAGKCLPEKMMVRELRFHIAAAGFRSETVTIATTLLDAETYPKQDIAELFFCRWQIELRLRDIKTILGMDILRTKTPGRARKELWMYLTAYNLLRTLMKAAAVNNRDIAARISFQGCRQRFLAVVTRNCPAKRFGYLYRMLLKDLAKDLNQYRPFRIEPRAIKRRKKQYDLLNRPREVLRRKLIQEVA